jgi:hypothetical protein
VESDGGRVFEERVGDLAGRVDRRTDLRSRTVVTPPEPYAARLNIDYPEKLDSVTTFFRLIWAIPAVIILSLLSATANETVTVATRDR